MTDKDNQISTLQAVRAGDTEARQQLLSMYTPMVIRIASGLTGRFMEIGRDEEISIGLLALNEAIDKYDSDRGASFTSFANLVISNRLRDYLRRQKGRELPARAISEQLPPWMPVRRGRSFGNGTSRKTGAARCSSLLSNCLPITWI